MPCGFNVTVTCYSNEQMLFLIFSGDSKMYMYTAKPTRLDWKCEQYRRNMFCFFPEQDFDEVVMTNISSLSLIDNGEECGSEVFA